MPRSPASDYRVSTLRTELGDAAIDGFRDAGGAPPVGAAHDPAIVKETFTVRLRLRS
jgi:hypothetical protein